MSIDTFSHSFQNGELCRLWWFVWKEAGKACTYYHTGASFKITLLWTFKHHVTSDAQVSSLFLDHEATHLFLSFSFLILLFMVLGLLHVECFRISMHFPTCHSFMFTPKLLGLWDDDIAWVAIFLQAKWVRILATDCFETLLCPHPSVMEKWGRLTLHSIHLEKSKSGHLLHGYLMETSVRTSCVSCNSAIHIGKEFYRLGGMGISISSMPCSLHNQQHNQQVLPAHVQEARFSSRKS